VSKRRPAKIKKVSDNEDDESESEIIKTPKRKVA